MDDDAGKTLIMHPKIIIEMAKHSGGDAKRFRAYFIAPKRQPVGVSASTTGNEICAVLSCAAKAFIKIAEPQADPDEIESRISLERFHETKWVAELQS